MEISFLTPEFFLKQLDSTDQVFQSPTKNRAPSNKSENIATNKKSE